MKHSLWFRTRVLLILLVFSLSSAATEIDEEQSCPTLSESTTLVDVDQIGLVVKLCIRRGLSERALALSLVAKSLAKKTQTKSDDQLAYASIGSAYTYLANYAEGLLAYKQAQQFGDVGSVKTRAIIENNIADVYMRMGQYEEAIAVAKKAIELYARAAYFETGSGRVTLAQAYLGNRDIALARETLDHVLDDQLSTRTLFSTAYAMQVDAQISFAEADYNEAARKAKKSIQFAAEKQLVMEMAKSYLTLAQAELALFNHDQSFVNAQQAVAIAQQQKDIESELMAWQHIQKLHQKKRQWDLAYAAKEHELRLVKKMFDLQLANTIAIQRVLKEVEQKELALESLQREAALAQVGQKNAEAQRTIAILLSVLLFAIAAIIYFRILFQRDRKRAALLQAEQLRLDTLKNQFLANTSHELRTPLNGIIGITDMLLEDEKADLNEYVEEELILVRNCGVQLSTMVDAILDFSQIAAGKPLCHFEAVELAGVISATRRLLNPLAQKKSLSLQCQFDDTEIWVRADSGRLHQVLVNLVGNAIKFTDHGMITLSTQQHAQQLVISVTDTGIGIEEKHLRTIFEPFEQIDGSLRRRHEGVGLGLAISREIIRAHGSELHIDSIIGRGSTFSFSLQVVSPQKT